MLNPHVDREFLEKRINVMLGIVIGCFIVFFVGFWYLQVIKGSYYQVLARENILKDYPIPAPRGLILDRNNRVLAENRLSHNLFITPRMAQNMELTLDFLSRPLGVRVQDLKNTIQKEGTLKSSRPVLIYKDLTLEQLAYISARKIEYPELDIKQETKRSYTFDHLFAHAIGYVGELTTQQQKTTEFPGAEEGDTVGQSGIERYYNKYLMGEDGYERKYVNSSGEELKELPPDRKPATPGKAMRLGLDYNMQKAAEEYFAEKQENGMAVAMDIHTGQILVLYSKPFYNPNDFIPKISPDNWKSLIADPGHPLQNRVIQNKFSPGSTFKIVMALAALQEKKITPETSFFCGGGQFIYNRVFRCWKPGGHGYVNLHQAIVHSCDVYFYNVGMRLDIDVIARYAKILGLGSPTGVDLPNESRGLVPSREWKREVAHDKWYPGETISVAVGQGPILVTALQNMLMYATVATRGERIRPHLMETILNPDGKAENAVPLEEENIKGIDLKYLDVVRSALYGVVNEGGTGGKAKIPGYDVCGKTGTVQVVGYDRGGNLAKTQKEKFGDHAWFVSFAPLDDPRVVAAIFVEHGGHGSDAAAPLAQQIFRAYFEDRKIPPPHPLPVPVTTAKAVAPVEDSTAGDVE